MVINQLIYNHWCSNSTIDWWYFALYCCSYDTEYCQKYAKPEDIGAVPEDKSSDEELSEDESDSCDDQVAGQADP